MNNISQKTVILLLFWLSSLVLVTFFSGLVYITVQQDLRQSANDPQIQLAEDTAHALEQGKSTLSLLGSNNIDIAKSLAPYITVYDKQGSPIASSGELNGKFPLLPQGVFVYTKQYGEDRITWQPQEGIRSAVVVTAFSGQASGYVMVGRSLKEIEKRENILTMQISIIWFVSLVVASVPFVLIFLKNRK